jgi:hypothetical protein
MRKTWPALFLIALSLISKLACAETVREDDLKAAMVYRFALFTDWPAETGQVFKLCAYGKASWLSALSRLTGKPLKAARIEVRPLASPDEAKTCQLVVLNPISPLQLARWVEALKGLPVLTVSDDPRAWEEDIMIALSTEPNRIVFNINSSTARLCGIKFSSQMLDIARQVR